MNFLTGTMVWIGTVILKGFVLKVLWGWFMTPLGVAAISIPQALGISIIVALLIFRVPSKEVKLEEIMTASIGISCFTLLLGYIIHLFM